MSAAALANVKTGLRGGNIILVADNAESKLALATILSALAGQLRRVPGEVVAMGGDFRFELETHSLLSDAA